MGQLCVFIFFLAQTSMIFWAVVFCDYSDTVAKDFVASELVPDVISAPPYALVKIDFLCDANVMLGNELPLSKVQDAPQYITWDADPNGYYTLAMVDPDAPSRAIPALREFLHWLVANIRGSDVASGNTLASYMAPTPPVGSGLHRYVFLVYRQCCIEQFNEMSFINRSMFSIEDFSRRYSYEGPTAGNFFQSQFTALVSNKTLI